MPILFIMWFTSFNVGVVIFFHPISSLVLRLDNSGVKPVECNRTM